MKLNRMLQVTRKTLLETLREPVLLILLLGLPAFFMLICYVGYGTAPKAATYKVLIYTSTSKADDLLEKIAAVTYADGRPNFDLVEIDSLADAEKELIDRKAAALLSLTEGADGQVKYVIRGDALYMNYIKAGAQLEAVVIPWLEAQQDKPQYFAFSMKTLDRPRPVSEFEAYVPGMMVFAILLIIPQTAMLIGRERRRGTLRRLDLSLLKPAELLGGICLAQIVVAVFQIVLMFASALLLGFHNQGSFLLALLIGIFLAFGSVGLGLLLGCFMKNDTDALNTGSMFSMLQVFMSGAFFMMPSPKLFTLFDYQIGVYDFIPATDGMLALQQVLSGGAGLREVWFRTLATLLLSLLIFLVGVLVFSRLNKKQAI
jgi:ABC-2 type transport system permease protein